MSKAQFYRNKTDLEINGEHVDAGALWKLEHANTLVLVDEDRFVSHVLDTNFE